MCWQGPDRLGQRPGHTVEHNGHRLRQAAHKKEKLISLGLPFVRLPLGTMRRMNFQKGQAREVKCIRKMGVR